MTTTSPSRTPVFFSALVAALDNFWLGFAVTAALTGTDRRRVGRFAALHRGDRAGAAAGAARRAQPLLLVAGLASGGSLLHTRLAPASHLVISSLQNNLVSPAAYGRRLRLNPRAILLAVMFWYAMWGVAGAFLAVPILAVMRVLTGYVRPLAPVRVFLFLEE